MPSRHEDKVEVVLLDMVEKIKIAIACAKN
jgi:hypothetical protein